MNYTFYVQMVIEILKKKKCYELAKKPYFDYNFQSRMLSATAQKGLPGSSVPSLQSQKSSLRRSLGKDLDLSLQGITADW